MAEAPKLIGEFLSELAENPDTLQAYIASPEQALLVSGLTEEQQETLLSNDLNRIKDAIRVEYGKAEVLLFIWVIGAANVILSPPEES